MFFLRQHARRIGAVVSISEASMKRLQKYGGPETSESCRA